jgi:hypothetical protein
VDEVKDETFQNKIAYIGQFNNQVMHNDDNQITEDIWNTIWSLHGIVINFYGFTKALIFLNFRYDKN